MCRTITRPYDSKTRAPLLTPAGLLLAAMPSSSLRRTQELPAGQNGCGARPFRPRSVGSGQVYLIPPSQAVLVLAGFSQAEPETPIAATAVQVGLTGSSQDLRIAAAGNEILPAAGGWGLYRRGHRRRLSVAAGPRRFTSAG